ncbi:MAG: hypothetical protein JW818_06575 [Pirellulales bacterium]|nr:hypothetical protein [Pirellulales bacterium]
MEFRRSGQRDPRRRRVLTDMLLGRSDTSRSNSLSARLARHAHKSEHYGDAPFLDEQLRLTDLIPRRLVTLIGLFVLGLGTIAGLVMLHTATPNWANAATGDRLAAFDLAGRASLAGWFSSTVLLLSAVMSVLVYTIRRHRTDDYQGHYRVWLWAALCWLLLSVDQTAGLRDAFREMMTRVTGTPLMGDGTMWWVIGYFFLLGGVGTRLGIDMWQSRLSTAVMLLAAASAVVAVLVPLGWVLPEGGVQAVILSRGAEMVAALLLLTAMGLHARYVLLDAEGLLPIRVRDEEDAEDDYAEEEEYEYDEDEVAAEETVLFGQNVRLHRPTTHRTSRPAPPPKPDAFSAGMQAVSSQVGRKLTKQEKKALRRRLEQERLKRQRRSA